MSCLVPEGISISTGDLIFLLCDESPFSRAIVASSSPCERLDHVGIVYHTHNGIEVIEANSHSGIVSTPLNDFLNRAPTLINDCGWRLRRVPSDANIDVNAAVLRAIARLGEKYNYRFIPTPRAAYCSELVYDCYLQTDGSHFFHTIPLNFNAPNGKPVEFWIEHFRKLKMPIPQNSPGTSPLSIYKQSVRIL